MKATILNMTEDQLVDLNNTYCQVFGHSDSEVYENDETFFEIFFNGKPMDAARAVCFGNYNYHHKYVKFNGYGNLESFDRFDVDDLVDSVDVMIDSIEDNIEQFEHLF